MNRLLLDTQVLLWAIYSPERLPGHITRLIGTTSTHLFVSDASVWEIGIKLAKGKLEYESELPKLWKRIEGFRTIPLAIRRSHIEAAVQLPPHHGDPFDRILVAQAKVMQMPIVSADAIIQKYDVHVIW